MSISNVESLKNLYAKISGNSADTINPHTISEAIDEITKVYESSGSSEWVDIPLKQDSVLGKFDKNSFLTYRKYGKLVEVVGKRYPVDASSATFTDMDIPIATVPEEILVSKPYGKYPNIQQVTTAFNSKTNEHGVAQFEIHTLANGGVQEFCIGCMFDKPLTWTGYDALHLVYLID